MPDRPNSDDRPPEPGSDPIDDLWWGLKLALIAVVVALLLLVVVVLVV
jgi:hypothetical protein